MAIVHLARILGPEGFSRIVAAKRLLPQFVEDADFVAMFLDEAKIASKIHHPNVVPVIDIVFTDNEVILVQEYVHGVPLDKLCKVAWPTFPGIPTPIVVSIIAGILAGLHAAHEAKDEIGAPLNVVHRDVSPHNVMISADGVARVLDFGIAKAATSSHITREGVFKGKLTYLAPEQLTGAPVSCRADIYGAGVVLWELLASKRLFAGESTEAARVMAAVVSGALPTLREALAKEWATLPRERCRIVEQLEPIVMRALAVDPEARFASAHAMLEAVLAVSRPASSLEVSTWLKEVGAEFLESKQRAIVESEEASRHLRLNMEKGPESASRIFVTRPPPPGVSSAAPLALSLAPRLPSSSRRLRLAATAGAALLCAGVVAVGAALLRPGEEAARSPASTGAATTTATGVVAPPPERVTPDPIPARPVEAPASASPAPAPSQPVHVAPPQPHPAPSPPPRLPSPPRPRAPERPRASEARGGDSKPDTSPSTPASQPGAAASANDCNPAYYLEGTKKVYKPNCL